MFLNLFVCLNFNHTMVCKNIIKYYRSLYFTHYWSHCVLNEDSTETLICFTSLPDCLFQSNTDDADQDLYCVTHIASTLDLQHHRILIKCWICDNFVFIFFCKAGKNVHFIMKNVFLSPSRLCDLQRRPSLGTLSPSCWCHGPVWGSSTLRHVFHSAGEIQTQKQKVY